MRQAEVIKLIGICSANYRNWPEEDKAEMMLALWMKMLSDTEYFIAEAAVEKFLAESKFPPTIADIRERIADLTVFKEKTAIEAWGDVGQAIRRYGWPNPAKALDSLSPITRKVVEGMGYENLCRSENDMADRAHFLRVYDTLAARDREDALMLQSTRDVIAKIQGASGNDLIRRIK